MSTSKEIHTINGYLHNVISLLSFIKEDNVIQNPETKEMLDIALLREEEVMKALESLKSEDLQ
jgi:hypothetical protein